jgi:hypothetical protein
MPDIRGLFVIFAGIRDGKEEWVLGVNSTSGSS